MKAKTLNAVFLAFAIYAFVAWLYGVITIATYCPLCASVYVAHQVPIRTDDFTMLAFVISFLSFIGWGATRGA